MGCCWKDYFVVSKRKKFKVQIDPELARVAYVTGNFTLYRIWVYATRRIGDGSGWVEKNSLEKGLRRRQIKLTRRSLNRYIQQGLDVFWTYDAKTKRVYLSSAERITSKLSQECADHELRTNQPGVRRMHVDLSGSIGDAIGHVYGAWIARKDKGQGVTISRDTLSLLWGVSIPTLLDWEDRAKVAKQANYAQQRDTNPERVPEHAYLCRDKSGENFVSWQLPNTYTAEVKEHKHNGNAGKVRQSVRGFSRQPTLLGVGGLLSQGKLYFSDGKKKDKQDGFKKCSAHLNKHQDVFVPHYVRLGHKRDQVIHERYDIEANANITELDMRDYAAEYDEEFRRESSLFLLLLAGQKV